MGHYCMRSCLRLRNGTRIHAQFTACERSSPKLTLRRKLSSGDKVFFSPAPTEILWMRVVSSVATFRATIEQPTKAHTVFLRRLVGRRLVRRPPDLPDLLLRSCRRDFLVIQGIHILYIGSAFVTAVCASYGGPGGRATRRCQCDDDDATVDDDDATIDDGDSTDDANAHTARSTKQYAASGAHRHAGHHAMPPTVHHTYIYAHSSCPRGDCESNL